MNIKKVLATKLPRHKLWAKGSAAALTLASASTLILCSASINPAISIFGAATAIETLYNRNQAKKILNDFNKTALEKLQILSANAAISLTSPLYHAAAIGTYHLSKFLGLAQVVSDRTGLSEQTSKLLPTNIVAAAVNPPKERLRKIIQDSLFLHPWQLEELYKYFPTFTELFTGISEKQFGEFYSAIDKETLVNNNTETLKEEFIKGISELHKNIFKIKIPKIPKPNSSKLWHSVVDIGLIGGVTTLSSAYNLPALVGLVFSTARQREISQLVAEKLNSPTLKLDMAKTVTNQGKLFLQWLISSGIETGIGHFINNETVSHEVAGNLKALASNLLKIPLTHGLLTPAASGLEENLYKNNLKPLLKIPRWLRGYLISPQLDKVIDKVKQRN